MPNWAEPLIGIILFIAAIAGVVGAFRFVLIITTTLHVVLEIAAQFRTNSGSSLKDKVDKMEVRLVAIEKGQVELRSDLGFPPSVPDLPSRKELYDRIELLLVMTDKVLNRLSLTQSVGHNLVPTSERDLMAQFQALNEKIAVLGGQEATMADGARKYELQQDIARARQEQNEIARQVIILSNRGVSG